MEETAEMEEMAEKDGGLVPVVTETATGLTLVLLLLLLLLLVVMIATAATTAAAATEVPEGKPYTIPPLDAPTWIAP